MNIDVKIGSSLKTIRKQKKMTQKDVAEFLNISTMSYSRYEQNLRQPDFDTLGKLCILFNVGIEFFFDNILNLKEYIEEFEIRLNEDFIDDIENYNNLDSAIGQKYRAERRASKLIVRIQNILEGGEVLSGELDYLSKQLKRSLKDYQYMQEMIDDFGDYTDIDDEIIRVLSIIQGFNKKA